MSRRVTQLQRLLGNQEVASDPSAHAALSASAGTGKTHVLTARVLRLLLQGVAPENILCLTFTKAAAAEMANRIGARLANWARLGDAALDLELTALNEPAGPALRERARQLFALVLDAPGGLKIQTLHAFSQGLLASFPIEAGIAPGFEPLDERGEEDLAREVLAEVASHAASSPLPADRRFLEDLKTLSLRLGEQGAQDYLRAAARRAEAMRVLPADEDMETFVRHLCELPEGSVAHILETALATIDEPLFQSLITANRAWGSGKKAVAMVANLTAFRDADPATRVTLLPGLAEHIVRKSDGEICAPATKQLAAVADYAERATRFRDWWVELMGVSARVAMVGAQAAGLRAGRRFANAYVAAKKGAGVADFDDLIRWTGSLLAQPGIGEWVRYKLDARIDHVLVDEAQDTNSAQWGIVRALVEDFFSGIDEAEERWRTLFMVGDFKQAIYRFQGADPQEFVEARAEFERRANALADAATNERPRAFRDLDISKSFRSAGAILGVTDQVIAELGHEAMGLPRTPPPHEAAKPQMHGRVEWWPAFAVGDEGEGEGEGEGYGEAESEDVGAGDAREQGEEGWIDLRDRRYADALARSIRAMVDEGTAPGDILVLLRRRSELASLIVARLYSRQVPVAGVDRLFLSRPLAVRDLVAAMAFATQPEDDLTLACLLTSPLLGWSQDALYKLSKGRGKKRLWRVLQERREEFADTHALLSGLLADADYLTPAAFLETILSGPVRGRAKLIARLGEEARDPIEELVSSAFAFERQETPSLDGFLAAMRRGEVEVKREAGEAGNAVRVMTVHGAKGLEAPVVILADATTDPDKAGGVRHIIDVALATGKLPFLRPRKEETGPPFAALVEREKEEERQEHWRLLYVGLTRAARRLVVTGTAPKGDRPVAPNSWHAVTQRALVSLGARDLDAPWGAGGLVHESGSARTKPARARLALADAVRPSWLDEPAPIEARPPRPLAPSAGEGEEAELFPPPGPGEREAARRGILVHALLERLPPVAAERRHAVADRWLETAMGVADAALRGALVGAALGVIEDPAFGDLFGPDALAEAPIAAVLDDGRVIAGTADRLLVTPSRVEVVDFKTGRQVPRDAAAVPLAHRAQMEAYAAALAVVFPGREVRASLLYTAGPKRIAIDA